jgi:CubicO group peptidase (beta-lactamase class C family)
VAIFVAALAGSIGCDGSHPPLPAIGEPAREVDRLSFIRTFAIDRVLDYRVWSGARSGFVALIARNGRLVYARTTGRADLEKDAPMALDTRFHIASMTKPVTAVAAMILVEDGRLSVDDPVAKYIPSFANLRVVARRGDGGEDADDTADSDLPTRVPEQPMLVRHLLTFTSGIGGYAETEDRLDRAWRSRDIEAAGLGSLAERVERIAALPLYEEPGTRWRYGWSADVLARVVEVAAREPFDAFLRRRIFEPLGMTATSFPDAVPTGAAIATMYTHDEDGALVPLPTFDGYYGRGWTPGGGGLVSTAPDFMRFALMLAEGGALGGTRILAPSTVAEMTRLHVPSGVLADMDLEGLGWGLGVCVIADADRAVMPAVNDGDYWWSGRFGTQFWVSPAKHTVVVVMQQTERGPTSDLPWAPSVVQALAMP